MATDPMGRREDNKPTGRRANTGPPAKLVVLSPTGSAQTLGYTPDGKRLAVVGRDGVVRVFAMPAGKPLAVWKAHALGIRTVAISANGRYVVSTGSNPSVTLYDLKDHRRIDLGTIKRGKHPLFLNAAAVSVNGLTAILDAAGRTHVWDGPGSKRLCQIPRKSGTVTSLSFHPAGKTLAIGISTSTGDIVLVNPRTCGVVRVIRGFEGGCDNVRYSSDGKSLIFASGAKVRIFDATTGKEQRSAPTEVSSTMIAGSKTIVATAVYQKHNVALFDFQTLKKTRTLTLPGQIRSLALDAAGQTLLVADDAGIHRYDIASGKRRSTLGLAAGVNSLRVDPAGRLLATGADDHHVRVWDLRSGILHHVFRGHRGSVRSLAFGPQGTRLATGSTDRTVRLWSIGGRKLIRSLGNYASTTHVAFDPAGRYVGITSDTDSYALDLTQGGQRVWSEHHSAVTAAIAFAPDTIIVGDWNKQVVFWLAKHGGARRRLRDLPKPVSALAVDPRHHRLLVGFRDGAVRAYNVRTGSQQWLVKAHHGIVNALAFAPQGNRLVTLGHDGHVTVRQAQDGKKLRGLFVSRKAAPNLSSPPSSVQYLSPHLIATGGDDGHVALWSLKTGKRSGTLLATGTRAWVVFTPDGYVDGSAAGKGMIAWQVGKRVLPGHARWSSHHVPGLLAKLVRGDTSFRKQPNP